LDLGDGRTAGRDGVFDGRDHGLTDQSDLALELDAHASLPAQGEGERSRLERAIDDLPTLAARSGDELLLELQGDDGQVLTGRLHHAREPDRPSGELGDGVVRFLELACARATPECPVVRAKRGALSV
jgi:hypothetical protein